MAKLENREKLVTDNLRLVNHLCRRFIGRGIEYEDLYQAGCMGLVKAVNAFNEDLGFKFSTYAVPVILGEMRRMFRDFGSVKVSRSVKELSMKITKEKALLENRLGYEPTVSQIAEALGVGREDVAEAIDAAQPALSLTLITENGENQTDIPVSSGEDALDNRILLDSAISKLSEEEQLIVRLRFFEQLTQSETAKKLGVNQVSISRSEKKILNKLRLIIDSVA